VDSRCGIAHSHSRFRPTSRPNCQVDRRHICTVSLPAHTSLATSTQGSDRISVAIGEVTGGISVLPPRCCQRRQESRLPARRTRSKLVRLTPEEFTKIEERARAAGQLPARYLRNAALTGAIPARPCSLASPDLLHALGAIGTALKAISRSSADLTIRSRVDRVLDELMSVLQKLATERHGS